MRAFLVYLLQIGLIAHFDLLLFSRWTTSVFRRVSSGKGTQVDLLRLLRLPGIFTALADVLTGFFIIKLSGLDFERIGTLPYMLGVSVCLYLAASIWNDLFDYDRDRWLHPARPIPGGGISMTCAYFMAVIFSLGGLMLSMASGLPGFLTASALLLITLLYNAVLKHNSVLGPLALGASRGLNLFLGMCAHTYILYMTDDPRAFLPPLFLAGYIIVTAVLTRMQKSDDTEQTADEAGRSQVLSTELDGLPETLRPPKDPEEGMRISELRRKRDMNLILSQNKARPAHHTLTTEELAKTATSSRDAAVNALKCDPFLLWAGCLTLLAVPLCGAYVMAGHWLGLALYGALCLWLLRPLYQALRCGSRAALAPVVAASGTGVCLLNASFIASVSQAPLDKETLLVCAVVAGLLLPRLILSRYCQSDQLPTAPSAP